MHSVEDTAITNVYEKARYHKISFKDRIYYYTRPNKMQNVIEIFGGSSNLLSSLLIIPYKKHDIVKLLDPSMANKNLFYMTYDPKSYKELASLVYITERKVEDDLINMGFKLPRKIVIPPQLKEILADFKE